MTRRELNEINLLHVDDELDFAEMTGEFLEREDEQFSVETATSAKEGLDYISEHEIDCIVSDYNMPGQNGIEFLEAVRAENPHLPFILFTGKGSEEVASEAISAGVTDYMQKESGTDQYAVLANRINNSVRQYRAEQESNRTKRRLQELTESTTDCRWMFSSDWDDLLYISGYEEVWNRPVTAVKDNPQDFLEGVHPDDRQTVRQAMERLSVGEEVDIEYRILRGDNTTGWVWSKGEPVYDDEREVVRVVGLTRDITERKEHERKLERTTERMELVLRSFDSGIWEYDYETETLTGYPEPCPIFGMEFDSIDGFFEKIRPADHEQLENAVQRSAETENSVKIEVRPVEEVEAEWVEIELRPILDDSGELVTLTGLTRDITEPKTQEHTLERTRERMELALDQTNSIIFEIECDTGEVVRHGAYNEFFDLSPAETPTWEDYLEKAVHPDDRDRFRQFYRQLIDGESDGGQLEYRTAPEHGDVRWIRDTASLRYESAGELRQIIGIGREITEYKEREQELQQKERRYQAIFDDPNILVGLIDTDGTVLEINETAMNYIDATREDVTGEPFWETPWFNYPESLQEDVRGWIERAADGEYVEFETDLVQPSGEQYTVKGVFRPVRDEEDDVVSLIISDREITEQKEYERELEQTNALLSTLFDTLPVGVLAEDKERNVVAVNEQMFELFDMPGSPDEVHGTDCAQLAIDVSDMFADSEAFVGRIDNVIAEQEPVYNEELELADGQTYARSYHPIELSGGDGHLWVYRDITARKTRETRLATLNETTPELMAAETRTEVAAIGVEAAADVLGLEASAIHLYEEQDGLVPVAQTDAGHDLIGKPPTFTGEGSIAWRVYEQGEALAIEDVHDNPDIYNPDSPVRSELILPLGEAGIMIASSPTASIFDEEDRVLGEILASNVTAALEQVERTEEIRAREAELARQNERLEEFASVVSHDLRNPVRVAEGRLELLKEECETEQVDAIEGALGRMDSLIEDILTLAREGDKVSEMEAVDLGEACETCWQHVETAEATLDIMTNKTIRADRSRLQQLMENLIRNAVEHGGDDVTVMVGDLETGFYVADDGPGISEDERESVFDAGYSTADDGTGFGLSIVKQIADAHGWNIRPTESEAGGERFEITGTKPA